MPKLQSSQRHNRTSPKRILAATLALIVVFLLLASVVGLAEKYVAIRKRVRALKEEQYQLLVKQEKLRETNEYIETKEGEEYQLRSKYNVVKPGEEVVVITSPEIDTIETVPATRVGRWWESLMKGLGVRE